MGRGPYDLTNPARRPIRKVRQRRGQDAARRFVRKLRPFVRASTRLRNAPNLHLKASASAARGVTFRLFLISLSFTSHFAHGTVAGGVSGRWYYLAMFPPPGVPYDAYMASELSGEINGAQIYAQLKPPTPSRDFFWRCSDIFKKHPEVEEALKYGKDAYDVYDSAQKAVKASGYTGSLNALVRDYGASGGASVLGVFVDRFAALARYEGIELNECALSVAKVAADIGGAVSLVSGFGVLLLGASIVATFQDSYSLARACPP